VTERTTVLLAEDDPVSRRILSHLLEHNDYEVLVAEDGSEALELIGPDVQVALIDWMMPGVDGVEVCRRLKDATDGRAYAIMVTAKSEKSDIVHALDEGADDYIPKPVDHDELLARVRAAERVSQRERRLAEAWSEARSEADRDALTGLYNRRAFDSALEELAAAPRRRPLALLMIDLDHFKRVNDTHGHQVGDEVLRQVAGVIREQVRTGTDVAARYGGEELAVIAPDTDAPGAVELAERIRRSVADLQIVAGGAVVSVTVSAGVAVLDPSDDDARPGRALIEQADARLYEAKGAGRNQVAA
jgi:diguanylate cyclase (GGDEF)-like protein